MRARIIFRGLTLFTFEKSTEGAKEGDNLGTMTAWLVSDPDHAHMPLHNHRPLLGLIGRDVGSPDGPGRTETRRQIPRELRMELRGHGEAAGVVVDGSFLDYVPRLGALHWDKPTLGAQDRFISRRIVITSGRIRTRQFISWDWHGDTPAQVAYMETRFQGFGANEVIVDLGDDSDFDQHDPRKFLAVTGQGVDEKLWPRLKGNTLDDDIDPNTAELLVTNLTARRRRPVFWGLHFQSLFDAAGYPRRAAYLNVDQFAALESAALAYDPEEWRTDAGAMGMGQPFPFLIDIDPERDALQRIEEAAEPYVLKGPPPPPPGRGMNEGIAKGTGSHDHGSHGTAHDPENTQICPFGRD